MKVIGTNSDKVLVELTMAEWQALGGSTSTHSYTNYPNVSKVPEIRNMAAALRKIRHASPDLQQLRSVFQTFLMLTEPQAVQEVLKSCGVAEVVQDLTEESDGEDADTE